MGDAYPELIAQKTLIEKVIKEEEEAFLRTLETGIRLLDKTMEDTKAAGKTEISGKDAFTLYDTFGFPLDLTEPDSPRKRNDCKPRRIQRGNATAETACT